MTVFDQFLLNICMLSVFEQLLSIFKVKTRFRLAEVALAEAEKSHLE